MKKVKILIPFHDIENFAKVYEKDTLAEFPDERADNLVALKLVEPFVAAKPEVKKPVEAEPAPVVEEVKKPRKRKKQ